MKKEYLLKLLPIFIGLTAIADTNLELLKSIGLSDLAINYVKLAGLLLALITPSVTGLFSKDEDPPLDEGIGGGGIKNPPKP